jgi:hypothetical protein
VNADNEDEGNIGQDSDDDGDDGNDKGDDDDGDDKEKYGGKTEKEKHEGKIEIKIEKKTRKPLKQEKVISVLKIKFLDAMNFVIPMPLKEFVKNIY